MPDTNVFDLPYENLGDEPGHSLHGGQFGTEDILAIEVERVLIAHAATDTSLESRIAALEAGALIKRWQLISQGTAVGPAFTIPVEAGVYSQLRLSLHGDLDGAGNVELRVNGDTTAALHRSGMLVRDAAGVLDNNYFSDATQWRLAEWSTVEGNTAVCHMIQTDLTDFVSFLCTGSRISSSATSHQLSQSWGRLVTARQVSSLNVRPQQGAGTPGFASLSWWLEGLPT